jgi:hypothetical protein
MTGREGRGGSPAAEVTATTGGRWRIEGIWDREGIWRSIRDRGDGKLSATYSWDQVDLPPAETEVFVGGKLCFFFLPSVVLVVNFFLFFL